MPKRKTGFRKTLADSADWMRTHSWGRPAVAVVIALGLVVATQTFASGDNPVETYPMAKEQQLVPSIPVTRGTPAAPVSVYSMKVDDLTPGEVLKFQAQSQITSDIGEYYAKDGPIFNLNLASRVILADSPNATTGTEVSPWVSQYLNRPLHHTQVGRSGAYAVSTPMGTKYLNLVISATAGNATPGMTVRVDPHGRLNAYVYQTSNANLSAKLTSSRTQQTTQGSGVVYSVPVDVVPGQKLEAMGALGVANRSGVNSSINSQFILTNSPTETTGQLIGHPYRQWLSPGVARTMLKGSANLTYAGSAGRKYVNLVVNSNPAVSFDGGGYLDVLQYQEDDDVRTVGEATSTLLLNSTLPITPASAQQHKSVFSVRLDNLKQGEVIDAKSIVQATRSASAGPIINLFSTRIYLTDSPLATCRNNEPKCVGLEEGSTTNTLPEELVGSRTNWATRQIGSADTGTRYVNVVAYAAWNNSNVVNMSIDGGHLSVLRYGVPGENVTNPVAVTASGAPPATPKPAASGAPAPTPTSKPAALPPRVPLFRLVNQDPKIQDHLYTTSAAERDSARKGGWVYEGITGYLYVTPVVNTNPLYRMAHQSNKDHVYTMNLAEYIAGPLTGWKQQGVTGYIRSASNGSCPAGTNALYRMQHDKRKDHVYTMSKAEYDNGPKNGWKQQGVAGCMWTTS